MSVELLQMLSLITYILAGLFFLVSVGLFFYLKVPALWGEVTGRTARKAIKAMKWKNEEASPKPLPTISHGSTGSGLSAKLAEATQARTEGSQQEAPIPKERTPLVAAEQKPPLKTAPVTEAPEESTGSLAIQTTEENAVLPSITRSEANLGQTAVLPTPEAGLTEVLPSRDANATDLLPRSDIGETAVLNATAYNEFVIRSTGELPRPDETTLLHQGQRVQQSTAQDVFFVMEKELAFTDSTEIIE